MSDTRTESPEEQLARLYQELGVLVAENNAAFTALTNKGKSNPGFYQTPECELSKVKLMDLTAKITAVKAQIQILEPGNNMSGGIDSPSAAKRFVNKPTP
jgi:hypothetical protein